MFRAAPFLTGSVSVACLVFSLLVGGIFLYVEFRNTTDIDQRLIRTIYSVFGGLVLLGALCLALLRAPPRDGDQYSDPTGVDNPAEAETASESGVGIQDAQLVESFSAQNPDVVDSVTSLQRTGGERGARARSKWLRDFSRRSVLAIILSLLLLSIVGML
ncbi:MAG: UNC93-like protein MFSD11 [Chloroflexi bacterium]|nr:UNC93-like protein MFSD11 [Chloroflexota bacterium]